MDWMKPAIPLPIFRLISMEPLSFGGVQEVLNEVGTECLTRSPWASQRGWNDLSPSELAQLIKAFLWIEELAPGDIGVGSTTQVPLLLQRLEQLDPLLSQELLIWAFHSSRNPYVPFGTDNQSRWAAQTVEEYFALEQARASRNKQLNDDRAAAAAARKMGRANAHRARLERHAIANRERAAALQELFALRPWDRPNHLLANLHKPPGFYPPDAFDIASFSGLTQRDQQTLLTWLRNAPQGGWRKIRNALTQQAPAGSAG